MKKAATVLLTILGLSMIATMVGISTPANKRTNESLSFTVKADRVVYDMIQQVIIIPIKLNRGMNASDIYAVLTYGWDDNGSSEKVIGEVYLKDIQWTAGIGYTVMISAELSIDEVKGKDKVDLIVFYDGRMTTTENLRPSSWTVVGPSNNTDNASSESNTDSTSSESSTGSANSGSNTGKVSSELDLVPIIPTKEQKRNTGSNLKSMLKQSDFISRRINHQKKAEGTNKRRNDLPETGSRTIDRLITWMGMLLILIVGAGYSCFPLHRVK